MALNRANVVRFFLEDEGLWPNEEGLQAAGECRDKMIRAMSRDLGKLPLDDLCAVYILLGLFVKDAKGDVAGGVLSASEAIQQAADIMGAEGILSASDAIQQAADIMGADVGDDDE